MKIVKRLGIVVKPARPYIQWARAVGGKDLDPFVLNFARGETLFLVNQIGEEIDPDQLIRDHFAVIFDELLHSWYRRKNYWPRVRTEEKFREWFRFRIIDLVMDLGTDQAVEETITTRTAIRLAMSTRNRKRKSRR